MQRFEAIDRRGLIKSTGARVDPKHLLQIGGGLTAQAYTVDL
jgi:hypothetical protein